MLRGYEENCNPSHIPLDKLNARAKYHVCEKGSFFPNLHTQGGGVIVAIYTAKVITIFQFTLLCQLFPLVFFLFVIENKG
jgi:hypothetical protein